MAQIGQFTRTETGFTGRLHTLILYRELTLVLATPSDSENAPDYRIHHGDEDGPEIGAGWKRTGEKAGEYISLQIDDPTFAFPIRANLFKTDGEDEHWALLWNRPAKRAEKRDERGQTVSALRYYGEVPPLRSALRRGRLSRRISRDRVIQDGTRRQSLCCLCRRSCAALRRPGALDPRGHAQGKRRRRARRQRKRRDGAAADHARYLG